MNSEVCVNCNHGIAAHYNNPNNPRHCTICSCDQPFGGTKQMNREDKLWSELTKEEKAEEKREFLESYAAECGGKPSDYRMMWEKYLNQEGYTGRDERILMKRERSHG